MKIIFKIFEWLIFVLLIFFGFVVMSPLLPTKKIILTYIVSSGSMEPAIQTGSIAFAKPIKYDQVKPHDIITFVSPKNKKQTILHRVLKIKKDKFGSLSFATKGDNNNTKDSWLVPQISLQGKYLFSIPLLGHIAAFIKQPLGFILMIAAPSLFIIILQIKTIRDGINEEVEKRIKKARLGNLK